MEKTEYNKIIDAALGRVERVYKNDLSLTRKFLDGARFARDTYVQEDADGYPTATDNGCVFDAYQRGEMSEDYFWGVREFQERLWEVVCETRNIKCGSTHRYN